MNVTIGIYALLLFIGGIMGYYKAESMVSLFAGSSFALLFAILAFQNGKIAKYLSMGLALVLFLFFAYRFSLGFKFMPAGLMSIASLLLLIKLGLDCSSSACCKSVKDKCCIPSAHKKP